MKTVALVASVTCPEHLRDDASELEAAEWLEFRADALGVPEAWTPRRFDERTIYALRSRPEGGRFDGDPAHRVARLASAAERFALVELEAERDLVPELLGRIPPSRRLIAWHGPAEDAAALANRLDGYRRVSAAFYKLVPEATDTATALAPLLAARRSRRADVIAYASGAAGTWTRVLAPRYGAPLVYGSVGEPPDAHELSLHSLVLDYGFPQLPEARELYGIVGAAVSRSLSPRLHNAAYRATGRPALFVSFHASSLQRFMATMAEERMLTELGLWFGGVTVASPHKEAAMALAHQATAAVRAGQSANNMRRGADGWHAGTTDPDGVLMPLARRGIDVAARRALVVGCGGAGRAVAAALVSAGARVVLMNRGEPRARFAAQLVGVPHLALADVDLDGFDIVVNATPVGCRSGEQPFRLRGAGAAAVVIDLAYGETPTSLVTAARASGAVTVDGLEVLRAQVQEQYRLLTGTAMPAHVIDEALGRAPSLPAFSSALHAM